MLGVPNWHPNPIPLTKFEVQPFFLQGLRHPPTGGGGFLKIEPRIYPRLLTPEIHLYLHNEILKKTQKEVQDQT